MIMLLDCDLRRIAVPVAPSVLRALASCSWWVLSQDFINRDPLGQPMGGLVDQGQLG